MSIVQLEFNYKTQSILVQVTLLPNYDPRSTYGILCL